jgi:succinate dehydrogenase / fumarate reductase cytochrome b subunit
VLATRSQAAGGLVLMLFLVVHLRQLRLPRPADGHALEVLQTVLSQPLSLALYLTAALAGAMHLFHGGEAAHRSLGWLDPANAARIRAVGRLLALLVGAGFMAVTLALALPVLTGGTP